MILSRDVGGFIRVFGYAFMRVARCEMLDARCGMRVTRLRDAGCGMRDKLGLLHIKVLLS